MRSLEALERSLMDEETVHSLALMDVREMLRYCRAAMRWKEAYADE